MRRVEEGWTLTEAAEAAGVSVRRAREWVRRARGGDCELADRRSGPRGRPPGRVCAEREAVIAELRGQVRMNAVQIADALAMSERTVRAVIARLGLSQLAPRERAVGLVFESGRPIAQVREILVSARSRCARGCARPRLTRARARIA